MSTRSKRVRSPSRLFLEGHETCILQRNMNGQDEAPKGNQPQTLAALLLRYIQKKNLPEKEIAARAGLTRSHLKKILYGNLTPSFVRGLTLCRVLGIPHSEYELLAAGDNPE